MLHGRKLRSRYRKREQTFCFGESCLLTIFLCRHVDHEAANLRLNICACYSWEMALKIGLNASLDNM